MMKKLALLVALAAVGTTSVSANTYTASPIELGAYSRTFDYVGTPTGSTFLDTINFDIGAKDNSLLANAVSLNFKSFFGIDNLTGTLWSGHVSSNASHSDSGGPLATFFDDNQIHNLGSLTPGQYHIDLRGTISGVFGGSYLVGIAAVPEPETYAMLLAGLGLMGGIARRRSKA